jgi:hypothetical protein
VAAAEEQRRALVLVVARRAERAARHPHRAGGWPRRCPRAGRSGRGMGGLRADEEDE